MKQLTKLTQGIVGMALIAASIGCGGSSSNSNQSSLAGSWVENPLSAHNTRITIASNGNVTGQSLNFAIGGTDNLTGTLSSNGSFIGQVTNDTTPSYTYSVQGTIKLEGNANQIRTTYTGTYTGAPISVDMTMIRN